MARSALIALTGLLPAGCGLFAPPKITGDDAKPPPPDSTWTAQSVMDNLERAFDKRDRILYEDLLDDAFWFTEADCRGDLLYYYGKEEELRIMGPRDGSSHGIFDIYRTIDWKYHPTRRYTEFGRDRPDSFEGDPDGHPDEDWEVFRGRVEIRLLERPDEGYHVDQVMTFKMREGDDGLWRIVRWMDDPLSTDCGENERAKPAGTTFSEVKAISAQDRS